MPALGHTGGGGHSCPSTNPEGRIHPPHTHLRGGWIYPFQGEGEYPTEVGLGAHPCPPPHLRGGGLATIWEEVSRTNGRAEGMANLNYALMMGVPLCWRFFGGRVHFSYSLPLLSFVKNMACM